jgi:hypothetical protein
MAGFMGINLLQEFYLFLAGVHIPSRVKHLIPGGMPLNPFSGIGFCSRSRYNLTSHSFCESFAPFQVDVRDRRTPGMLTQWIPAVA